jgi:hypothetical protein
MITNFCMSLTVHFSIYIQGLCAPTHAALVSVEGLRHSAAPLGLGDLSVIRCHSKTSQAPRTGCLSIDFALNWLELNALDKAPQ